MKINYTKIYQSLARTTIGEKRVQTVAQKRLDKYFPEFLKSFDEHEVTKEIEAGIDADNSSGTLGGYGNLFSFIGFKSGSDPIRKLREALKISVKLLKSKKKLNNDSVSYTFSIKTDKAAIRKASRLPFESGVSWAYGIEKGISGFGHYIALKLKSSRSGGGIQQEKIVRSGDFRPVGYLTELIKELVQKIRSGQS